MTEWNWMEKKSNRIESLNRFFYIHSILEKQNYIHSPKPTSFSPLVQGESRAPGGPPVPDPPGLFYYEKSKKIRWSGPKISSKSLHINLDRSRYIFSNFELTVLLKNLYKLINKLIKHHRQFNDIFLFQ